MVKQVICDIVAAEKEAGDIVARAQAAAREAALISQEKSKSIIDENITEAKFKAKESILQKKDYLNTQAVLIKQKNETEYEELLREAEFKMEDAADFIAERIL